MNEKRERGHIKREPFRLAGPIQKRAADFAQGGFGVADFGARVPQSAGRACWTRAALARFGNLQAGIRHFLDQGLGAFARRILAIPFQSRGQRGVEAVFGGGLAFLKWACARFPAGPAGRSPDADRTGPFSASDWFFADEPCRENNEIACNSEEQLFVVLMDGQCCESFRRPFRTESIGDGYQPHCGWLISCCAVGTSLGSPGGWRRRRSSAGFHFLTRRHEDVSIPSFLTGFTGKGPRIMTLFHLLSSLATHWCHFACANSATGPDAPAFTVGSNPGIVRRFRVFRVFRGLKSFSRRESKNREATCANKPGLNRRDTGFQRPAKLFSIRFCCLERIL